MATSGQSPMRSPEPGWYGVAGIWDFFLRPGCGHIAGSTEAAPIDCMYQELDLEGLKDGSSGFLQSHPRSPVRTKIVRRGTRWPQERERGEDGAPGLSSPVPESEGPGAPGGLATPAHRDETAMNGAQLFRDPLLFPCSLFPISWTLAFYFLFPVSCFLFLGPWLSISCSLFLVPCSLPSAIPCCLAARTWLPGGPGPG